MTNLKPMFTPEQVRNLFREAIDITEKLNPPEDLRVPVFEGVKAMLGQHEMSPPLLGVPGLPSHGLH